MCKTCQWCDWWCHTLNPISLHVYMSGLMKTVLKNWNRALSERFYKNEKENQSSFPFLYPFIFFSLPSFLSDFMSVYMAWRKPKSSVNSRFGVEFFSTIFINPDIYLTGFVKRWLQKSQFCCRHKVQKVQSTKSNPPHNPPQQPCALVTQLPITHSLHTVIGDQKA